MSQMSPKLSMVNDVVWNLARLDKEANTEKVVELLVELSNKELHRLAKAIFVVMNNNGRMQEAENPKPPTTKWFSKD